MVADTDTVCSYFLVGCLPVCVSVSRAPGVYSWQSLLASLRAAGNINFLVFLKEK